MIRAFALLALLVPAFAQAANFNIYSGTGAAPWSCTTARVPDGGGAAVPVGPGDTITIHSHAQGDATHAVETIRTARIELADCRGTQAAPIVVRNDPNDTHRVTIRYGYAAGSGSTALILTRPDWVTVDGTGGWSGMPAGARCGGPPEFYDPDTKTVSGHGTDGCGIYIQVGPQATSNQHVRIQGFVEGDGKSDNGTVGGAIDVRAAYDYDGNAGVVFKGLEIDGTDDIPDDDISTNTGSGTINDAPFPRQETGGVGMYLHDINNGGILKADGTTPGSHPGAWRENFLITQNYIHHSFGEHIYSGNNPGTECTDATNGAQFCAYSRNMEISHNILAHAGRDCVNPKMWVEGDNSVHDNFIVGCAFRGEDWEEPAIIPMDSKIKIYNNKLFDVGGQGIQGQTKENAHTNQHAAFEPFLVEIYNNLVVRAGARVLMYEACDATDFANNSDANPGNNNPACPATNPGTQVVDANSGYAPGNDAESSIAWAIQPDSLANVRMYNNTVVNGDGTAYRISCANTACDTSSQLIMNNIAAQAGAYRSFTATDFTSSCVSDNYESTVVGAGFVDAAEDDYRLTDASTNVGAANDAAQSSCANYVAVAATDIDGVQRPQGSDAERGAYETLAAAPSSPDAFTITVGTTGTWDCETSRVPDAGGSAVPVGPGDTIYLQGGTRGRLRVVNCVGTEEDPIYFVLDPESSAPATLTNGGVNPLLDFREFDWLVIDGTTGWDGMTPGATCGAPDNTNQGCGFRLIADADDNPVGFFRFFGESTKNVEVRGVYIDASASFNFSVEGVNARYGFYLHDVSTERGESGVFRENYLIEKNYITGTRGTAFYVGPNASDANGDPLPLRDIVIRDNVAENVGGNGILLKSATEGANAVDGNIVTNTGRRLDSAAGDCIRVADGGADIYDNRVSQCGARGINLTLDDDIGIDFPVAPEIYNNVVDGNGVRFASLGHGIRTISSVGDIAPSIYSNTVVDSTQEGIRAQTADANVGHTVANNLVGGSGGQNLNITGATKTGNVTGSVRKLRFTDPEDGDFTLQASSPAVDSATATPYSDADIVGTARPEDSAPDAGAYEFVGTPALRATFDNTGVLR